MQEAVPAGEGAMAAILGLDDNKVVAACEQAAQGEVVAAVNFNSPGQVVIAGNTTAVQRVVELVKQAGAKRAVILPVSVPSHCALMKPAADKLAARLQKIEIRSPKIPVVNNVDVTVATEPDTIRAALARQLHNPVRWVETIQKIAGEKVYRLVECGPGKVLVGLNKRIERQMQAYAVYDTGSLEETMMKLKEN